MQPKHRTHLACAAQLELAQAAPLFDPAKHLLDAAAGVDRFGVALVARGAAIDGGTTRAGGVLSDVRRDADATHLGDKPLGVIALIGTQGFLVGTGTISRHCFGGIPFPGAHCLGDVAVDDQGMAVVHQYMPPVARLGWVGVGLAGQQSVWITAGTVGLVAELDAAEVAFRTLLAGLWSTKALARP